MLSYIPCDGGRYGRPPLSATKGSIVLTDESRLASFPTLADRAYLNTAAEGIPPLEVGQALAQYFRDKQMGMDGRKPHFEQWQQARKLAGGLLGLTEDEVGICSCSSEAYNLAALALNLQEGDEVVVSDLDFPAGATPWLQPSCPATVKLWKSSTGGLQVDQLASLLSPRTRLVQVSLVSFFNGYKVDLPAVCEIVRKHCNALISVDVTQALGRIPLQLDDVDLIVSSTHKWILASHGGGIVGVPQRKAEQWTVPAGGWLHLENAFEADRFEKAVSKPGAASFMVGMPNFPAIYAIRAGLQYISQVTVEAIERHTRPLVDQCLEELAKLPVELLTPTDRSSVAGIIAFRHPKAEEIHAKLLAEDIHIMAHAGRLRIALHGYNTAADVERLLRMLHACVA